MENTLIPLLQAAFAAKRSPRLAVSDGFSEGDTLHLLALVAGHPAGSVLPVLGYCRCADAAGEVYALLAYVKPSATACTAYAQRDAAQFAAPQQTERWLGSIHLFFAEVDITDHAEELALERRAEVFSLSAVAPALRQAA